MKNLNNDFIISLYRKHQNNLKIIRQKMSLNYSGRWEQGGTVSEGFYPQYDDTEAEITSLLILESQPKNVVEFSPCTGWSTSIILDSLELNNIKSNMTSYDVNDRCTEFIRSLNHKNVEWDFKLGDVQKQWGKWNMSEIDYLFIDSDHSYTFACGFTDQLLRPLLDDCRKNKREVVVSVHDVFHTPIASEEGQVVLDFLIENNLNYYSAAKAAFSSSYWEIQKEKQLLGLSGMIHSRGGGLDSSPSIFFVLK